MKLRKILSAILAGLILVTAIIITPAIAEDEAEILTFDYSTLYCSIVNNYDSATVEKDVTFQGKNAVKVTPKPDTTHEKTVEIQPSLALDSYYKVKGVDLTKVRYVSVEYYLDMEAPYGAMQFSMVNNPGGTLPSGGLKVTPTEPMVVGKWATAIFDFSVLETRSNPEMPMLQHIHLHPYGTGKYSGLKETDICYIGKISFFTELPSFEDHEPYMNGYTDGTFLPGNTMTRAEACTTVARIVAGSDELVPTDKTSSFTDVASHWGNKYIAYVESLGYLKPYSGAFLPDKAITRAEFVELVYNMGLLQDAGKSATFTDVDAAHPRYNVITASAKAGLVNGYDNGDGTFSFKPDNTITRAEVVTVINRARGRDTNVLDIPSDIAKIFADVDRSHWAFGNIVEATVAHEESKGLWTSVNEDPQIKLAAIIGEDAVYGFPASEAKLAELDALEEKRIAEIRTTPADYSTITGKKIYVSSSTGNDSNNGLTEATPVKSIAKANEIAAYGDGILLKRGDMWRESVYAESGITYTAYGEGAKPFINASPENGADPSRWTLVHEDTSTGALIWKYANESFLDTGVIVLNDGEGGYFGEKVVCNFNGTDFYLRNDKNQTPYSYTQLGNMQFFHEINVKEYWKESGEITPGNMAKATGPLYFRCDYGNPGRVFESIEFATRKNCMKVPENTKNVVIDNLCLKYSGFYGVSLSSGVENITVKNCEIGWVGGTISTYGRLTGIKDGIDRHHLPVRLGNGIELYGTCDGFYIDNNYVYQCYDAGITPQVTESSYKTNNCRQDNIRIKDNVVTDCVYSIEYFLGDDNTSEFEREGVNFLIEGNLFRRAGWGFGSSRSDNDNQRHIQSWDYENEYYNLEIKNNIFDRAEKELVHTYTTVQETVAKYSGNTYIQGIGNGLYTNSIEYKKSTDLAAHGNIQKELGDMTAQVYLVPNIPKWEYKFPEIEKIPVTEAERAAYEAYLASLS